MLPASYDLLRRILATLRPQERAMTAATPGPSSPNIFSMFSSENGLYRTKREAFVFSLAGQAAILAVLIYLTSRVVSPPITISDFHFKELPLIYSGHNGGGGGNHDPLPASAGSLPMASLEQFTPPTVMHPTAMPKLPMPQSVEVAPELKLPQGGQIGDPLSKYTVLSDGSGGPTGISLGCCGGVGPSTGPFVGDGPPGIYPAGKMGATIPEVIYNPEPSFSDEARKAKQQGIVGLMLVVGKDGRTYDIRVRQSLGMGLDEKAIEAVSRWRFRPATRSGLPVATQIAVEVNFRLY
jgi:protein TonB